MGSHDHAINPPLSGAELERLWDSRTEHDWTDACNTIKARRGGVYPPDWYARIIRSGLGAEVHRRWPGGSFPQGEGGGTIALFVLDVDRMLLAADFGPEGDTP